MLFQVTHKPWSSSPRRKVLIKLRALAIRPPGTDVGVDHDSLDREPDERHRNQRLPAQTHDLIVSIAREGRAQPQEGEHGRQGLQAEPEEARLRDPRIPEIAVERRQPPAEEKD